VSILRTDPFPSLPAVMARMRLRRGQIILLGSTLVLGTALFVWRQSVWRMRYEFEKANILQVTIVYPILDQPSIPIQVVSNKVLIGKIAEAIFNRKVNIERANAPFEYVVERSDWIKFEGLDNDMPFCGVTVYADRYIVGDGHVRYKTDEPIHLYRLLRENGYIVPLTGKEAPIPRSGRN
jgi:hypothetical protein